MPLNPSVSKVVPGGGEVLVNYNYVDAAAGIGYVDYYLGRDFSNGVSGALISNQAFYSDQVTTAKVWAASGAVYEKINEVNFDMQFKKPQVIRGDSIVNIPVGVKEGDDANFYFYTNAIVKKWDGTTETNIGTASGSIVVKETGGAGTYAYAIDCIKVVVPETLFKVNETLRLTVQQYGRHGDAGLPLKTATFFIGHDPKNRATSGKDLVTFGTEPSIATFKVPFKLDLP